MRSSWLIASLLPGAIAAADSIDFNRQILPILSDACFRCHGPDAGSRKARLRLDQHEGLFRTREDVTVVVPGKPEASELVLRITSKEEDEVMPPRESNRQLKPAEIDLLQRWIAAGAPWGTHWAFSAPAIVSPPAGAPHPIDAFVRARLAREKLPPAPEAERTTLIRRVTLDLTGVPPSVAEVTAFLADSGKSDLADVLRDSLTQNTLSETISQVDPNAQPSQMGATSSVNLRGLGDIHGGVVVEPIIR